jgi:undecaprenyl pyrophosphate phosphatase UppP
MFLIIVIFLQIILESMPVSSSGHLALLSKFFNLKISEQLDYFLHGPTIIILMVVFYRQWSQPLFKLIKPIFYLCFKQSNVSFRVLPEQRSCVKALYRDSYKNLVSIFLKIVSFIFIADLATVLIFFVLKALIQKQVWFNSDVTLLIGFCITFLLLILLGLKKNKPFGKTILRPGGFVGQALRYDLRANHLQPSHKASAHTAGRTERKNNKFCTVVYFKLKKIYRKFFNQSNLGNSNLLNIKKSDNRENICPFALSAEQREVYRRACPTKPPGRSMVFPNGLFLSKALILGIVQGLALFPGISRFASVYVCSRYLNIPKRRAFELTFLLQFSIIVPGFFLGTYKLTKLHNWHEFFSFPVVFSIMVATVISFFVLKWCKKLAYENKLWRFAFYMLFPVGLLIHYIISK